MTCIICSCERLSRSCSPNFLSALPINSGSWSTPKALSDLTAGDWTFRLRVSGLGVSGFGFRGLGLVLGVAGLRLQGKFERGLSGREPAIEGRNELMLRRPLHLLETLETVGRCRRL
jgi:hypothetical protein